MRKHVILSLTLLLVLATAIAAGAQTTSTDTSKTKKSTTKTVTTKPDSTKPKYHRATGDITAMDATAKTFTIKHGKDSWTFKTDSSTKYRGLGKTIGFDNLKEGDNVRVSYTEDGSDKTAARVDVLHGKKSHA